MTVLAASALLSGECNAPPRGDVSKKVRVGQSSNLPPGSYNSQVALTSGNAPLYGFYQNLVVYVSSGPSDLTIVTLDGTSFTISALATGTLLDLDIQFYKATWTGTATASALYMG